MAQVTVDFAKQMLVHCERGEHPPITINEAKQLAYAFIEHALAAQSPEGEPVAKVRHTIDGGYERTDIEWLRHDVSADTLLYAHPAPAPASPHYPHTWDDAGERCTVCGDKDWMGGGCTPPAPAPASPTEHTAADAPNREAGSSTDGDKVLSQSAAGVPDVEGLIVAWGLIGGTDVYAATEFTPDAEHRDEWCGLVKAEALAALQVEKEEIARQATILMGMTQRQAGTIAQQAERIRELEAQLAELKSATPR